MWPSSVLFSPVQSCPVLFSPFQSSIAYRDPMTYSNYLIPNFHFKGAKIIIIFLNFYQYALLKKLAHYYSPVLLTITFPKLYVIH